MHRALLCVVITLFGLLSITCAVPLQDYTGTQLVSRKQVTASEAPLTLTVRFPLDPKNPLAVSLTKKLPPPEHIWQKHRLENRTLHEQKIVSDGTPLTLEEINEKVKPIVANVLRFQFPEALVVFEAEFPLKDSKWTPDNGTPFHLHLTHKEKAIRSEYVGTMKCFQYNCRAAFTSDDLSGRTPFPTSKEVEAVKRSLVAVRRAEK
ncbi:hypothetical protein GGU10DRAFT_353351 [Lentinula aff. detonsa]|uniref:Uncharacterized protein n=1 Tax=Lentinula aff. detonsa TaxID=2804958 RepID=A0AA38KAD0_9AGAR|nr:hypothetical protein GGU10DRAFT_353351 [Lentinula aff. detonsa]